MSSLAINASVSLPVPTPASTAWVFQPVTTDPRLVGQWGFTGPIEDAFITFVDDTSYATEFILSPEGYLQLASDTSFYANIATSSPSQIIFFNTMDKIVANGWTLLTCERDGGLLHCCTEIQDTYLDQFFSCPTKWAAAGSLVIAENAQVAGMGCTPLHLRTGPKPLKFGEFGAAISL